jgi:hypothetical protein
VTEAAPLVLYEADTARHCGDCQLCCRLLPMPEISKPANTRCQYQKFKTGCAIYTRRPRGCMYWSCRWLLGNDTADVPRPDRAHYVIDPTPDFIRMVHKETGELQANVEVVQVWIDPAYPDAHRDPALRRYLHRRGEEGIAAVIRYGSKDGFVLMPPQMTQEKQWREVRDGMREPEHSFQDYLAAQHEPQALRKKDDA